MAGKPSVAAELVLMKWRRFMRLQKTPQRQAFIRPAAKVPEPPEDQRLLLRADEGTKRTVFDALIFMLAPVFGLRPVLAARLATLKVPKPMSWTLLSFLTPLAIESSTASSASEAAR